MSINRLMIAGLCLGLLTCVYEGAAQEISDKKEVVALAMVGDQVITSYDVDKAAQVELMMLPGSMSAEEKQAEISKIKGQILESMIEYELAYLEFQALGGQIPQSDIQDRINRIIKDRANGDPKQFEEALFSQNMTRADFEKRIVKDMAVEALTYGMVKKFVRVLDSDVDEYIHSHSKELAGPAQYHVLVIALAKDGRFADSIKMTADEIMRKLASGVAFDKVAAEYSDSSVWDLGWQTEMTPKLQNIVTTLKPGQIYADLLDMGNKLYIVKLEDYHAAEAGLKSEETRENVKNILKGQQEKKLYEAYFHDLYLKHPVIRLE